MDIDVAQDYFILHDKLSIIEYVHQVCGMYKYNILADTNSHFVMRPYMLYGTFVEVLNQIVLVITRLHVNLYVNAVHLNFETFLRFFLKDET